MSDWISASIWLHTAVAPLALGTVVTLGNKSSFALGPAEKARKIARELFDQMASELQRRLESALDHYSDDHVSRSIPVLISEDQVNEPLVRRTRILASGAEAIRNDLDDYLSNHSPIMSDWTSLRRIGKVLSDNCTRLRSFCLAAFISSVVALAVAVVGPFLVSVSLVGDVSCVFVILTVPLVAGALIHLCIIHSGLGRLSPLEVKYDDLLA